MGSFIRSAPRFAYLLTPPSPFFLVALVVSSYLVVSSISHSLIQAMQVDTNQPLKYTSPAYIPFDRAQTEAQQDEHQQK